MDLAGLDHEGIVVFAAGLARAGEAASDLKPFGGGQAHHGLRKVGLEFVEDGLTESHGDAAYHALNHSPDAVAT